MEKAILLDMSDYIQSGEGANGASYDCISDQSVMVKLYNTDYPVDPIYSELEVARKVYEIGVPSPEPGELVTDGERLGIKFRRIVGKRSYSRMLADEPERYDEFAREYARHCKKVHQIECPEGMFPDAREQFLYMLDVSKEFTPSQKNVIADFIRSVPDCNTAVHGDMHMGNGISTLPVGAPLSTPHEFYFIDLGYFAHGCPLFDLGMMQNICLFADEDFRFHDFHIHGALTKKFWNSFADEYFFGPEKYGEKWFGKNATIDTVNDGMMPYYSVKMLLVNFNLGFMPPSYLELIRKTFGF